MNRDELREMILEEIRLVKEDEHAETELRLFIDNDSQLYRSRFVPIVKNLIRKKKSGKYDSKLAVKGFMYLVDDGAKKYAKEFDSPQNWNKMFPKSLRLKVAQQLVDDFEDHGHEEWI